MLYANFNGETVMLQHYFPSVPVKDPQTGRLTGEITDPLYDVFSLHRKPMLVRRSVKPSELKDINNGEKLP